MTGVQTCALPISFSIITRVGKTKGTTANIVEVLNRDSNIFAKRENKTVSVIGISEAVSAKESKINMSELRKEVGTAPTEFHGYSSMSEENVVILSGLVMPYSRIDTMTESVEKEADTIKNSMLATTEVRTDKSSNAFDNMVTHTVSQTDANIKKPSALERLEKMKAKMISK